MKVIIGAVAVLGLAVIVLFAGIGASTVKKSNQEFLRLHVRANSNSPTDQDAKNLVRETIVGELAPLLHSAENKAQAMYKLRDNLQKIQNSANRALAENGYDYTAAVGIKSEVFPTRSYSTQEANLTLPEGLYDALVLELGEGKGDNWWCCIYPPLCFLENNGTDSVNYKSKILDFFKKV